VSKHGEKGIAGWKKYFSAGSYEKGIQLKMPLIVEKKGGDTTTTEGGGLGSNLFSACKVFWKSA